ncbi:MAG: chromosome segregation protein SMC [Bacillota bacterium]
MQLKKLEVYGFKSFADKTVIEFPAGITAIVGPNGSGKSNVVDAIRWVLGEQSAKELRGEKVEDFIFNGSKTRHKLGYTQVSLTFDNCDSYLSTDFNEVTITRKAYRSGESEYYLNKSRCRLKDIQELFLDTGLGRHSFAMISQGQVESLIEARPIDRRQLFDDACGINKYKVKKDETLRKLERTELDLARATDIALELEGRIEPLKVAKENAERYLELKDALTESKEKLILSEYLVYWKAANLKREEKVHAENQTIELNNKLHQLEVNEAKLKNDYDQIEENLSKKQNELFSLEQSLQQIAGDLRVIKERQVNLREKNRLIKETIFSSKMQKKEQEEKLLEAQSFENTLLKELNTLKEELDKKQVELEEYLLSKQNNQTEIEKTKDDLFSLVQEISDKKNQKNQLEKDLDLIQTFLSREESARLDIKNQLESLEKEKTALEIEIATLEEANTNLQTNIDEKTKDLKIEQEKLLNQTALYDQKKEKLRAQNARYEALCATEEDLIGYQAGVKAILKAKKPGILGAIAKIIKVDNELTKAVEAVLGGQLQGVVTSTDFAAQKAIDFLKEEKLGKATFYPLNLLEARPLPESDLKLLDLPGVLGLLSEFLEFNHPYDKQKDSLNLLAKYLGGRTFVTDNLENARQLARACRSRYRIVTKTGEVIWTGGTMSGGEEKEERVGLLKRQALTRYLKEEILEGSKLLTKEKTALESFALEVDQKNSNLIDLVNKLKQEQMRLDSLKSNILPISEKIAALENEINTSLIEEERLDVQTKTANKSIEEVALEITKLEKKQKTLLEDLNYLVSKEWTKEPVLRASYQQLKDQETIKRERLASSESKRDELLAIKDEIAVKIASQYEELGRVMLSQVQERLNALNKNKLRAVLLFESETTRKSLKTQREEKAKMLELIGSIETQINALRPEISKIEALLRDITGEYAKLESQIENTTEKAEELGISILDVSDAYDIPKEERTKLQQVVRMLDKEINALGIVNVGAIGEYKEVYERYTFLSTQITDLSTAKADLLEVLSQLDKQSREKFLEAFYEIKAEFESLFTNLFGGGQATLLLEEGDILEAGIEIKAQPPGKKLQSIALLSGGEKTLTAIALVFAVISVKKVPFYLFDEVDAALDEANLLRFLALIKDKAEASQIILITHRRRSMEEAHLLYGVTMEEKGVSKILALRLEDKNAAATYESN